ncbi:hypothetical protein LZ30DRAFT_163301 [Colletotrichum cereale]|nr:hypothetical protein LZ30DRAFT_163301 [Colletotrichum cereale]
MPYANCKTGTPSFTAVPATHRPHQLLAPVRQGVVDDWIDHLVWCQGLGSVWFTLVVGRRCITAGPRMWTGDKMPGSFVSAAKVLQPSPHLFLETISVHKELFPMQHAYMPHASGARVGVWGRVWLYALNREARMFKNMGRGLSVTGHAGC